MRKEEVVTELLKSANENGLIDTLYGVFGKSVKVRVPFSTKACDTSYDRLTDVEKQRFFYDIVERNCA